LLIYIQNISPRTDYIFSILLSALGIKDCRFTSDKAFYKSEVKAKINYSSERIIESEVWIKPVTLLFENEIKEQQIDCFDYSGSKAFFKTSDGDFSFDIFAAAFYLISRYEEYLPHKKDMYGRYAHENSIAFKEGFLQLPLVNIWLQQFGRLLTQKFPGLTFSPAPFTFLPTYDIDIAYSYLHKGFVRNAAGFIKSMWKSEWALVKERMNVLFAKQQDPFDSYAWLDELHTKHQLRPLFFFLVPQKNKGYDKNILPSKRALKNLIQTIAAKYDVGIHPSWQSGDNPQLLREEIKTLQTITAKKIIKSRQHYIRMNLPDTYRRLINEGITEDYSMGYGSINGFRASWCLPYAWYDLQKEETTSLIIYPFCYMDANSFYEQQFSCEEASDELKHYYQITKDVNGLFITIWHNHFLGTDKMFMGWKEILEPGFSGFKGLEGNKIID